MESGKARAIGVSNYTIKHLEGLLPHCKHIPAVNQVECHPKLVQQNLREFCESHKIAFESYSPLAKGALLNEKTVVAIAKKYNKTPAQILVRWGLEHGDIVIPKSESNQRIEENANIFDFSISKDDMSSLDALDENWHCTWDPTHCL